MDDVSTCLVGRGREREKEREIEKEKERERVCVRETYFLRYSLKGVLVNFWNSLRSFMSFHALMMFFSRTLSFSCWLSLS